MLTPQQPAGLQQGARNNAMMAGKMLQQALGAFEVGTKEYKSLLNCLKSLGDAFGKTEGDTEELMPAELKHMISQFAGPGMPGGPPGGQPGAPPGGAPPPGAAPPGAPPPQ